MKSHKEILEEVIDEIHDSEEPYFNNEINVYDGNSTAIFKAMNIAAKQAFEIGYDSGYESHIVVPKYQTFEDYLKDLEDGTKENT